MLFRFVLIFSVLFCLMIFCGSHYGEFVIASTTVMKAPQSKNIIGLKRKLNNRSACAACISLHFFAVLHKTATRKHQTLGFNDNASITTTNQSSSIFTLKPFVPIQLQDSFARRNVQHVNVNKIH